MTTQGDARTQQLEAEIEAQREQLAATVDQIGHKLDVKKQAQVRLRRVRPEQVVMWVGIGIVVGGLVWWRRGS
jgi:hypothetical protein